MGSMSRYSALERYVKEHEQELIDEYSHLVSETVVSMNGVEDGYYIRCDVMLSDGNEYETHFRWGSEEEQDRGEEILDEGDYSMHEYYEKYILGHKIASIGIGFDRDDMVYCYAFVEADGSEKGSPACLEIPIISVDEIWEAEAEQNS